LHVGDKPESKTAGKFVYEKLEESSNSNIDVATPSKTRTTKLSSSKPSLKEKLKASGEKIKDILHKH
jgi:hypothetical protein